MGHLFMGSFEAVPCGPWKRTYNRFRRWAHGGILEKLFEILLDGPKNAYLMIDSRLTTALGVPTNTPHRAGV